MSPPTDVDIANMEVTTATVMNLIAGRLYTFTVTVENSNGSASIDCGPVRHDVGKPDVCVNDNIIILTLKMGLCLYIHVHAISCVIPFVSLYQEYMMSLLLYM